MAAELFFLHKVQSDYNSRTEADKIAKYFIIQLSLATWQVWMEPLGIWKVPASGPAMEDAGRENPSF